MSHVTALKKMCGEEGVMELEHAYGKPIRFSMNEDVPVREEVRIIELCLDIQTGNAFSGSERAREAGHLHFRNFSTTPLGSVLLPIMGSDFKVLMMRAANIAHHVFSNIEFNSQDLGEKTVEVTMKNADYPLEHFQGFFEEWLIYADHSGKVEAKDLGNRSFAYTISWD